MMQLQTKAKTLGHIKNNTVSSSMLSHQTLYPTCSNLPQYFISCVQISQSSCFGRTVFFILIWNLDLQKDMCYVKQK